MTRRGAPDEPAGLPRAPLAGGMKVLEIFARNFDRLPLSMSLLIAFGVIFVMTMLVSAREPVSVAVVSGTLLVAYLAVLVPHRRLFRISADARRLMRFVGMPWQQGRLRFFVPSFTDVVTEDLDGEPFRFVGLVRDDVEAVIEIVGLLAEHDLLEKTHNPLNLLIEERDSPRARVDCAVFIGGPRVSAHVAALVEADPVVSLTFDREVGELALVVGGGLDRRYTMRPPSSRTHRSLEQTAAEPTYGCVMKRGERSRVRFAIWGLDARGTVAAAHWLATEWSTLSSSYDVGLDQSFTAILRVPPRDDVASPPVLAAVDGDHPPLLLPD